MQIANLGQRSYAKSGRAELPIRIVRGARNDYLKTAVDEIQWVEAAGIYSLNVNLRHVETLVGNSLKIGNELFIFLGVRKNIRKSLAVLNRCCIFVVTNSATLPVEQRTRAELLLYIGLWNTRNDQ